MSRKILTGALNAVLLPLCFVIALGIVNSITKFFPIYVGVAAVWFVLTISVYMMIILLRSVWNHRMSLGVTVSTWVLFTIVAFIIAVDKPTTVDYDTRVMVPMAFIACVLASLPFIVNQEILRFSEHHARRDSIYFGASIMWLSTFFADMIFLLKWSVQGVLLERLRYMMPGGAGFNDVLFYYGTVAFLALSLFHLTARQIHIQLNSSI